MTAKLLATAFIVLSIIVKVVKPTTSPTEVEIVAREKAPYAKYAHLFDKYEFEYLATHPDLMDEEIAARKGSPLANKPKKTTAVSISPLFPDPYEYNYFCDLGPDELAKEIAIRKYTDDPYQRNNYRRDPSGVPGMPPKLNIEKGDGQKQIERKRKEWEREKNKYNPYYQIFGDKFKWPDKYGRR